MITFEIKGAQKFAEMKKKIIVETKDVPNKIEQALLKFSLRAIRSSKKDYLSGPRPQKLGVGTGLLRSSISAEVGKTPKGAFMKMGTWVPYARIHEEGGQTPAHVILPKNGKFLVFTIGGKKIFTKKVNHPGSVIKARPFLRPAIDDNLPSLKTDLKTVLNRLKNVK